MTIFLNFNPFFIFSSSGHVGWRSGLADTILEEDRKWTIPPKLCLKWLSGFRGEDFLVIVDGRTMTESDDKCSLDPLGHVSEKWVAYYFLSVVKSHKIITSTITS